MSDLGSGGRGTIKGELEEDWEKAQMAYEVFVSYPEYEEEKVEEGG